MQKTSVRKVVLTSVLFAAITGLNLLAQDSAIKVLSNKNLGISVDNPTHKVEIKADTTVAGGLSFGGDTTLYRSAPGYLKLGSEGEPNNSWLNLDFSSWTDGVKISADGSGINLWFDTNLVLSDDRLTIYGSGTNSILFFQGDSGTDVGAMKLALGTPGTTDSEYFVISHGDDMLLRPSAQPTNPTLRIFSRDGTLSPTDTIDIYHDQDDAKIDVGSGSLIADSEGILIEASTKPAIPLNSGQAGIYSKSGELYSLDDDGNESIISPHNEKGEWVFYSKNTRTGRVVEINMEKVIRTVEKLSGEKLMVETWEKK